MNKKKLSVVMAGAMLASSVAPVLAAETMSMDQRGLVLDAVRKLMKEKMLTGTPEPNDSAIGITVSEKGKSDKDADGNVVGLENDVKKVEKLLRDGFVTDKTIRVYEKETTTDAYGKLTDKAQKDVDAVDKEVVLDATNLNTYYEKALQCIGFKNEAGKEYLMIKNVELLDTTKPEKGFKVVLNAVENPAASEPVHKELVFKVGDKAPNFAAPVNANGTLLNAYDVNDVQSAVAFKAATEKDGGVSKDSELTGRTLLQEIDLVGEAALKADSLLVSDLFDGLMLTNKGVELLEALKADVVGKDLDIAVESAGKLLPGIYGFNVVVRDNNKIVNNEAKVVKTITVRGLDQKDAEIVESWLRAEKFNVGELVGANRFDTAVKIAKEQAELKEVAALGHVVLVNGDALVDGLAAAPLAASLGNGKNTAAPMLLTKAGSLPKETAKYLVELVKAQEIQNLSNITIDVVGGSSVVSEEVVNTLKGMGFSVVRHGGDNREETSMEVIDAMKAAVKTLYVVGAEGEADAMSIAPVASQTEAGILVAKKGGLSKVAYKAIEKAGLERVVILGGEKNVSAAEEAKLKEIVGDKKVSRIAGANRKATNAAIIKAFYKDGGLEDKAVVVAKDKVLVDALASANLATQLGGPIVLAGDKLSNEQINVLNLEAEKTEAIYQIGGGVSRDNVIAKLAELFELPRVIK